MTECFAHISQDFFCISSCIHRKSWVIATVCLFNNSGRNGTRRDGVQRGLSTRSYGSAISIHIHKTSCMQNGFSLHLLLPFL